MSPADLLSELRRRGVQLLREGPQLRIRAPRGAVPPKKLLQELKNHKKQLLEALPGSIEARRLLRYTEGPYAGFAWSPDSRRDVERGERLVREAGEYAAARMENARALSAGGRGFFGNHGAESRIP